MSSDGQAAATRVPDAAEPAGSCGARSGRTAGTAAALAAACVACCTLPFLPIAAAATAGGAVAWLAGVQLWIGAAALLGLAGGWAWMWRRSLRRRTQ